MKINESVENYLECIFVLKNKNGNVRSIDIANELGFSKASVSVAVKNLSEENLIVREENGSISLTKKGRLVAEKVYEKHRVLADAFIMLGVDEKTAYEDSCKMEHCISDITFNKLKSHFEEIKNK